MSPNARTGIWGLLGKLRTWTMTFVPAVFVAAGFVTAAFAATHDFNNDHRSDILWRNPSPSVTFNVVIWFMNGATAIGGGAPGSVNSDWAVVGQRDFNGDGNCDILWRNGSTGQVVMWFMNGASAVGNGSPGTVTTDWSIIGTGDFNGDGKSG